MSCLVGQTLRATFGKTHMSGVVPEQDVDEDETRCVVTLHGDIDFNLAPDVRALLLDCVERGRELCLDMSEVTYLDSAGIACLLETQYAASAKGVSFSLADVGDRVMRTFGLARLDRGFTILENRPRGGRPTAPLLQ